LAHESSSSGLAHLYLDALFIEVRDEGRAVKKALSIAVGVNLEGRKELLGLWLGQGEGAKFYLQLPTELKSRVMEDIFISCVDGLKDLPEAIESVFPKIKVQTCGAWRHTPRVSSVIKNARQWPPTSRRSTGRRPRPKLLKRLPDALPL